MVNQLRRNGTEEQKQKYLPKLLSGEHVGSLAMSEPGAGSDVVSMRTTAYLQGDKYVMNGSKAWITNSPIASTFLIYAKSEKEGKPSRQMTAFLVEKGMKGFTVGPSLDKFGVSVTTRVADFRCADRPPPSSSLTMSRFPRQTVSASPDRALQS